MVEKAFKAPAKAKAKPGGKAKAKTRMRCPTRGPGKVRTPSSHYNIIETAEKLTVLSFPSFFFSKFCLFLSFA